MSVPSKSARAPASAKPTKIAPRLSGRVLNLRAGHLSRTEISRRVHLSVKVVTDLLRAARDVGDARALTDAEVSAAKRRHAPVAAPAPIAVPPPVMTRRAIVDRIGAAGSLDPARLNERDRMRVVHEMHEWADRTRDEGVRDGLRHLADLYQHCPTFYPNFRIESDVIPACLIPPAPHVMGGGAALMCAEA